MAWLRAEVEAEGGKLLVRSLMVNGRVFKFLKKQREFPEVLRNN